MVKGERIIDGIEMINLYEAEGVEGFKDAVDFFFDFIARNEEVLTTSGCGGEENCIINRIRMR